MKNIKTILLFTLLFVSIFSVKEISAYTTVLRQGNTGSQVKLLQQFLNKELNLKIPLTGYFGPITKNAVNQFQTKYAKDILTSQGLSKATGVWAGGSIKKAKSVDLANTSTTPKTTDITGTKMFNHPVFGYIPMNQTSAPSRTEVAATPARIAPSNLTLPVVIGSTTISSVLTASHGSWLGSGDFIYLYQWLRDDVEIIDATSTTYVINNLDFGKNLSVRVTALNDVGSSTATSTDISDIDYSFLPVPRIAFVGDSITTYISASANEYQNAGFGSQARAQTGSLFDFYINPNTGGNYFAQSGTKTDVHLSTYMPQALAAGAKVIVYHGGTNDSLSFSPRLSTTTVAANIEAMINLAIDNDAVIILTPVLGPSPSPVTASTTERVAYDNELNEAIEALAVEYNMPFVDWRVLTEVSPGRSKTGILSVDNLHPNQYGAWQMGSVLAETLMNYIQPDYLDDFWSSVDAGTYGDFITVNPNYKFNTLTGTSSPAGYTIDTASWTGSPVIKSIVPRVDGVSGNWWQIEAINATTSTSKIYFKDTLTRRSSSYASSSATSTITLGSVSIASVDIYKDHRIWIIEGTGAGQTRKITAYSGSRVATVDTPWVTLPDTTSKYIVGLKDGERVQFFAEINFDSSTDIRGLGGYYRAVDQAAVPLSGDLSNGGEAAEPYRLQNPSRTMILKGPVTTVSNYFANGYSQLQFYFAGSGILKLGRVGVIGVDRLAGQLTFTP